MSNEFSVQATAPLLGVRVTTDGGEIRVLASDTGGRGYPIAAAFVPVVREDRRLRLRLAPNTGPGTPDYDWRTLQAFGVVLRDTFEDRDTPEDQRTSPYLYTIASDDKEPFEQGSVLVLLVYIQAPGVGAPMHPQNFGLVEFIDTSEVFRNQVAEAIMKTLTECTASDLRGGFIEGFDPVNPVNALLKKAAGPAELPERVTFAAASCQYPSDILDRMPDDEEAEPGPADASMLALGKLLGMPDAPTLLLLLGDQVYVDATAGLFDPRVQSDKYRIPYENLGQSRGAKAVLQRMALPVYMVPDDHEIRDNWAPNDPDSAKAGHKAIDRGREAYWKFQRSGRLPVPDDLWRNDVVHLTLPFFLGDTRTEREGRTALSWRTAKIMKDGQFDALCTWLVADEHAALPKFVATPSAVLPRRLEVAGQPACALHSDAWDGYPASLHALLAYACDQEVKGLVLLSGDEHISSMSTATVTSKRTGHTCTLHSVHSSALYAPYPFANAVPADFPEVDDFDFPCATSGTYHCHVETHFPAAGDGFALLTARRAASRWSLDVRFHSADGVKANGSFTRDLV